MDTSKIISNSIRATLFGKFYEKIIRKWFETELGFIVYQGKPRIYWKEQPPLNVDNPTQNMLNLSKYLESYKQSRSFCTPDGLLIKERKYFIWEAKNWPKWYEPIDNVIWRSPWLIAKKVDYRKEKIEVKGIIFSWWSRPRNEEQLLAEVRKCVTPNSFDIYYTSEILNECLSKKPEWYIDIVTMEKKDIIEFFQELLGQNDI